MSSNLASGVYLQEAKKEAFSPSSVTPLSELIFQAANHKKGSRKESVIGTLAIKVSFK